MDKLRDRDAEVALLASSILNESGAAMEGLSASDFFDANNQKICAAILGMSQAAEPITITRLTERLNGSVPASYLGQLLDGVPARSGTQFYRERVQELSRYRRGAHAAHALQQAFLSGNPERIAEARKLLENGNGTATGNAWSLAVGMEHLLAGEEEGPQFLEPRILARGALTEIFSPRGLGKSLFAIEMAVRLSKRGLRVLLVDRDNPRSVVRERLRGFGATPELAGLKFISRDNCPPLTNASAWASFPYLDFDVVIIDSLDSAAEGVGEQDSAKPSRAIAVILDIARKEGAPAVLLLGNCVRTGAHSRGSGVIEDRADAAFELRDATNFRPTGRKAWVEELPPADAGSWASRSSRRRQCQVYRLAFIATKFRLAEEPAPFIMELDLTTEPWTLRDVTDSVDQEGASERRRRAEERAATITTAVDALVSEVDRRYHAGEPPLLKERDAVPFLVQRGLTRNLARETLSAQDGRLIFRKLEGTKGNPVAILSPAQTDGPAISAKTLFPGMNYGDGGNKTPTEPAKTQATEAPISADPHEQGTAEMCSPQTSMDKGSRGHGISAEIPTDSGPRRGGKREAGVPVGAGTTHEKGEVEWEA